MRKLTLTPEANVAAVAIIARALPKQMQHKIGTWIAREDMSVAEAAKRLGTTDRTLRRRIDAGEIAVYTNPQGHLRVALYA
jgi:excisionase family DNA binding protein